MESALCSKVSYKLGRSLRMAFLGAAVILSLFAIVRLIGGQTSEGLEDGGIAVLLWVIALILIFRKPDSDRPS